MARAAARELLGAEHELGRACGADAFRKPAVQLQRACPHAHPQAEGSQDAAPSAWTRGDGGVRLSGGALLVLGAALAQATFFVSQKALLRRHRSLAVTAWAMGLTAAMALPLALGLPADVAAAPPAALLAVGFLALGASALGFLTWAYAVARIDVTAAASTLYAVPPVAALVGWVALGELPSALTAVGGAIALTGVAITARSRTQAATRPMPSAVAPAARQPGLASTS